MQGRSLLEFTTIGDDIPRLDVSDNFEEYEGGFDPDEEAYSYSLGEPVSRQWKEGPGHFY